MNRRSLSSRSNHPSSPTQEALYVTFDTGVTRTKAKGGIKGNYSAACTGRTKP